MLPASALPTTAHELQSHTCIPNDRKVGWCTKQGGSFKTWQRRWFVLSESAITFYKGEDVRVL